MIRKLINLFIILLLTGCQSLPPRRGYLFSEYGKNARVKYVHDKYYVEMNSSIMVLNNNRFESYIFNEDNPPYLYIDFDNIYVGYFGSDNKTELGRLNSFDIDNLHYQCINTLNAIDYAEFSICYEKKEIFNFRVYNNYPYTDYNNVLLFSNDNIYLLQLQYKSSHPYVDESINGPDYVGSEIFRVDIENKKIISIYSTNNTTAIAYGNEDVIYFLDDQYDIYCLDLDTNNKVLAYDAENVYTIYVEYCHDKLFIFENDENINVIDIE